MRVKQTQQSELFLFPSVSGAVFVRAEFLVGELPENSKPLAAMQASHGWRIFLPPPC
jgi:hypothetical protein